MANYPTCCVLQRIVLPLVLLFCAFIRPCGFSAIYLLMLFVHPFIAIATPTTLKGCTHAYFVLLIAIGFITCIAQVAFQIVLVALPPYAFFLSNCDTMELILRHIGLIRMDHMTIHECIIWMIPEIVLLPASIFLYIAISKLAHAGERPVERAGDDQPPPSDTPLDSSVNSKTKKLIGNFFAICGLHVTFCALCVAAALRPSFIGLIYFFTFLIGITRWACAKPIGRKFGVFLRVIAAFIVVHLVAIYLYQLQWFQKLLTDEQAEYLRYVGISKLLTVDCSDPRDFIFADVPIQWYLHPFSLYILYYLIHLESSVLINSQVRRPDNYMTSFEAAPSPIKRNISQRMSTRRLVSRTRADYHWKVATRKMNVLERRLNIEEYVPLIRGVSPRRRTLSGKTRASVDSETPSSDIPMQPIGKPLEPTAEEGNALEHIIFGFVSVVYLIMSSSYLATNIIMMVYSITYHSWPGFILLLWANVLWLFPNQRKAMLQSSPFLVIYAILLLLLQYMCSMDLKDAELVLLFQDTAIVQGIRVNFCSNEANASVSTPILVKSLYTLFFWITMREYMKERQIERQNSTLSDMAAPLQLTMGAATSSMQADNELKENKFMKNIGNVVKNLLALVWIWIVAVMLFVIAISGTNVTGFRIIYMALFLVFVLTFQLSWQVWRKSMYTFWLTVIVYSMIQLVTVYTYQFDNFDNYWEEYLFIPKQLQGDIGLQKYDTRDLFFILLIPTFFVVITVVQIHYFHQDFLRIYNIKYADQQRQTSFRSDDRTQSSDASEGAGAVAAEPELSVCSSKDFEFSLRFRKFTSGFSLYRPLEALKIIQSGLVKLANLFCLYVELHGTKIILYVVMLVVLNGNTAPHFALLVLICVGLGFNIRGLSRLIINIVSITVSVLVILQMIYQFKYIDHTIWETNCSAQDMNKTFRLNNTAEWLGFYKANSARPLNELLSAYNLYLFVSTFVTIVYIGQFWYRQRIIGSPQGPPKVMFPGITRAMADRDTIHCIKYFLNYFFYKFGVEVSLISIAVLMAARMDIYSMFYGVWLILLVSASRTTQARFWPALLLFCVIILPFQFSLVVGLPPFILPCEAWPWETNTPIIERINYLLLLQNHLKPPPVHLLLYDFFVLLFVSRQALVFRVESSYARGDRGQHPGGSNTTILKDFDSKQFINPVPDFVTYLRTWLDLWKRIFFTSLFWITLAFVFLTGAQRVNLFSIGYFTGAFIFLWQGTDVYLKPVNVILRSWNRLISYNLFVIICKSILQLLGCVFLQDVKKNACWTIQLLGVGCSVDDDSSLDQQNLWRMGDPSDDSYTCQTKTTEVGLAWDCICFVFLLIQRRIYSSYYFFHLIDETKAMTILSSRGAELIEHLRMKQIKEQEENERRILEKIKMKMDKIKANQQRIQGPHYVEPTDHFTDGIYPHSRPLYRAREPKTNRDAIRSGDYYMFDTYDDDDDDESLMDFVVKKKDDDLKTNELTVSEFLHEVIQSDIKTATEKASRSDQERRASVPLTRKRSTMSQKSQKSSLTEPIYPKSAVFHSKQKTTLQTVVSGDELADDSFDDARDETDASKMDDGDSRPKKRTWTEKILDYLMFLWAFLESCMISLTIFLNKFSHDYRYIARVLAAEKKLLKSDPSYRVGVRRGSSQVWAPIPTSFNILQNVCKEIPGEGMSRSSTRQHDQTSVHNTKSSLKSQSKSPEKSPSRLSYVKQLNVPEIRILAPSMERGLDQEATRPPSLISGSYSVPPADDLEREMSSVEQPAAVRLSIACWFVILSHSDLVCYMMTFINQLCSASLISLPLPLLVFLWGTMTIPRPTKTFWVTIIAYTEVIVLLKCMFQFEVMPWNQDDVTDPTILSAAKILGIEKQSNFALYDLLLLMVVFFHRSMLKSLGLWRSTTLGMKEEPSTESIRTQREILQNLAVFHEENEKEKHKDDVDEVDEVIKDGEDKIKIEGGETLVVPPEPSHTEHEFPSSIFASIGKYVHSIASFWHHLIYSGLRVAVDVYAYLFLCDFINFLVLLFGFTAFSGGQSDDEGGVSSYIAENKVPASFLVMLIIQFLLIIIDRALYLRKNILGKVIYHYVLIFGIHIWMFFAIPYVTERPFNATLPPKIWYLVKCFYFIMSAYQIRSGYPKRILGNFLCKAYNYLNWALFKIFLVVPFLYELRTVMDWMCTDTSMTLNDWLKMEDIFTQIYQLKCSRHSEKEYPQPRGQKKTASTKYIVGGGFLFGIIAIIWFPLVLFALGNTVGQANIPYDVTVTVRIGPYQKLYEMSAQNNTIYRFGLPEYSQLQNVYSKSRKVQTFLSNYEPEDIAAVSLTGNSTLLWGISPPDLERLIEDLNSTKTTASVKLSYSLKRVSHSKDNPETIYDEVITDVPAFDENGEISSIRQRLVRMINGDEENNTSVEPVPISFMFPKFLKVTNLGLAKPVLGFMEPINNDERNALYRNITLKLSRLGKSSLLMWWEVREQCDDWNWFNRLNKIAYADCENLVVYTFNEKVFPKTLSMISGGGIIGLYTTLVFLASRVIHSQFAGISGRIMFEDLPNVDRILQLCLDIYLVRESGELCLEEDLFAKLTFLFRSPETMIKWTRPKEENENDDDNPEADDNVDGQDEEREMEPATESFSRDEEPSTSTTATSKIH